MRKADAIKVLKALRKADTRDGIRATYGLATNPAACDLGDPTRHPMSGSYVAMRTVFSPVAGGETVRYFWVADIKALSL